MLILPSILCATTSLTIAFATITKDTVVYKLSRGAYEGF